jgi:signal transduction histidine kinase
LKFFHKLFLCTVLLLTVALSALQYITFSMSLSNALEREVQSELSQHQMVKYAIESDMLNAFGTSGLNWDTLEDIVAQSSQLRLDGGRLALYLGDDFSSPLYSTLPLDWDKGTPDDDTILTYITEVEGEHWLMVGSAFYQSGYNLHLVTAANLSGIYEEYDMLLRSGQTIYLVIILAASIVTLVFSWVLTRPIRQLQQVSSAFAQGDYQSRVDIRSQDEFGTLSTTYNQMADTIQGKIAALEQAAREKEEFVANFAHELKTPLTSIIGYADTIYQKPLSPEEVHHAAGYIVNEGMRLEALSFKLLELSALQQQDFMLEETELAPFFDDICETMQASAEKRNVSLTCRCENAWVRMEVDLFKTLLVNLMDNALKSGGTAVVLCGKLEGDTYEITVSDNGRGIPAQELERITEAFYMVDKSRSRKEHGAGLGLALAAKIAALHGTRLVYESELNVGTIVHISMKAEVEEREIDS